MYLNGATLREIGDVFNVTRERIRQLLKAYGVDPREGGASKRKEIRAAKRLKVKDAEAQEKYGCSYSQYIFLRGLHYPTRTFTTQKKNAHRRGIAWELKLWDWWEIWQKSGKWEQRGRRKDRYCMARRNDEGPYSKSNVEIVRFDKNSQEGVEHVHQKTRSPSELLKIIRACGGRSHVAEVVGVSPATLSGMANNNYLPVSWDTNGNLKRIAELHPEIDRPEEIRERVGYSTDRSNP